MNRLGIVLALAVGSLGSVACAVSSDDDSVAQSEDKLMIGPGGGLGALSCHRFPDDTCVTVGAYCERHGGHLWCDLAGNCTCQYSVMQRAP